MGTGWPVAFALFGAIAAFGIGNGVQANGVAQVLDANFGLNTSVTGVVLMVLTAAVILGGITRIGMPSPVNWFRSWPSAYIVAGLLVLLINIG